VGEQAVTPADAPARRRRLPGIGSPVAWAATVLFAGLMVVWSITTPQFRNPDEPSHVDGVVRLMEGHGWPAPGHAHISPEVLRAKTLSGFSAIDGQMGNWAGGTLLPGVRRTLPQADLMYYALYSAHAVTPPADRLPFAQLHVTRKIHDFRYVDQMTQHPPMYYGIEAGILKVLGASHWRYDRAIEAMRLLSALMVVPVPLLAFSVARRLTGRRRIGDLASVVPLGIPQFAAIGAAVSNDALVILIGSVLVLLMTIMLTAGVSWRLALGTGVVLGLGLFTKGTLLFAVPVVGLALVVGARRTARLSWGGIVGRLAGLWVLAFAVGGWWWALNLFRYGTLQPNGLAAAQQAVEGPRLSAIGFARPFTGRMATTFWGEFGQLELPLPQVLVAVVTIVLLIAVLLVFRVRGVRTPAAVLLAYPVLTLIVLYDQTYASHRQIGQFAGVQGRYLYGSIVAIAALAAVGVGTLPRAGSRAEGWLPPVALLAALAGQAYGFWVAFRGFYVGVDMTLRDGAARMLAWSPFPRWFTLALVAGLVAVALVGLVVAVWQALRPGSELPPGPAADAVTGPGSPAAGAGRQPRGERSAVAGTAPA
jgi:4-amino-4-deoxy-L-arabinose transferase-like glycosyltransferase